MGEIRVLGLPYGQVGKVSHGAVGRGKAIHCVWGFATMQASVARYSLDGNAGQEKDGVVYRVDPSSPDIFEATTAVSIADMVYHVDTNQHSRERFLWVKTMCQGCLDVTVRLLYKSSG